MVTTNDLQLICLSRELRDLGIPDCFYSLGNPKDEKICLVFSEEKWLVYYYERGHHSNLREFESFDEAKNDLINYLLSQISVNDKNSG